jgi:hypothetical protein
MRPPRFRLRTLLIAVLAVGLILWGRALWGRRNSYLLQADLHATQVKVWRELAGRTERREYETMLEEGLRAGRFPPEARTLVERDIEHGDKRRALTLSAQSRQADYHARLMEKYLRAAARPWLPVAPDPPTP